MRKNKKSSKKISQELESLFEENLIDYSQVEIWFQDESRVGQQGSLSRIWAKKGTRPRAVRQQQYLSTYLFGAVCPEKAKTSALILPKANTAMMEKHLQEIEKEVGRQNQAVLIVDRASWHTTQKLQCPKNIKILPLPPTSPELNPMEQVWQILKRRKLSNRVFQDEDEINLATANAWNHFAQNKELVKSLCSREWAKYRKT